MAHFLSQLTPSSLKPLSPVIQKGLFVTGLAYLSYELLTYTSKALSYLLTFEANLLKRYGAGSWALITGGSDGIGLEFAFQLAQRGFNIILVARNLEKLEAVKKDILAKHSNIQVKIVIADFKYSAKEGFFEEIYHQVQDLDISILLNNVGVVCGDQFHEIPIPTLQDVVIVNCVAQAILTRLFLPKLLSRTNKDVKSAIVDICSMASEYPRPYLQAYGATKMFSSYLSQGLAYEYPDLDIISLKPGLVSTKMSSHKNIDWKTSTTVDFVESVLRYMGKTSSTSGHWKHQWQSAFLNAMSEKSLKKRLKTNLWILVEANKKARAAN